MKATVVCPVRNEGPFILDWVVWYRMLGFSKIVILTNDCTDHSLDLLAALKAAGWVDFVDCVIPAKAPIYYSKMKVAHELRSVKRADWVLVCDIDEYLVIHRGDGRLADLVGRGAPQVLGMALNWRVFGTSGIESFEDKPVHRQFLGAIKRDDSLNRTVKTLFNHARWFGAISDHGPRRLNLKRAQKASGVTWGTGPLVWVNASGKVLPYWKPEGELRRTLLAADLDHSVAQMNHYMLRSAETFGMKRGTRSPSAGIDRYTQTYWDRANAVVEEDRSALRYQTAFAALRSLAMALPDVARLHHQCCADYIRLIAEKAGKRAQDDPRHAAFLARAAG